MTVEEAVQAVRQFGTLEAHGGGLKLRVRSDAMGKLSPAIEVLRLHKSDALETLGSSRSAMRPAYSKDEPVGVPWAEWKAAVLNRLFQQQGVTGELGRITPETIRDGERKAKAANNPEDESR